MNLNGCACRFPEYMENKGNVTSLVFDLGTSSMRAGWSLDHSPNTEIPAVVGVWAEETQFRVEKNVCKWYETGSSFETGPEHRTRTGDDVETKYGLETRCGNRVRGSPKYAVDVTSLFVPRKGMEAVKWMDDGMIENWDLFEEVLDYTYSKRLNVDSQVFPVLFSESPLNTKSKREKLVELMFEKYQVPATYLCKNAVLASFAHNKHTCVVVDSGETHTTALTVRNGFIVPGSIVKSPLGGRFLTEKCSSFLTNSKIKVYPKYMVSQRRAVKREELPVWRSKISVPKITLSWHRYMLDFAVQDFKHSVLQVSEQPLHDSMNINPAHYEFPNGYNQDFGIDRYKIPELLFKPDNYKDYSNLMGIKDLVLKSIESCDESYRSSLWGDVLVTGRNSQIKGFSKRLSLELRPHVPATEELNVSSGKGPVVKNFGAWVGGSIMASIEAFQRLWFNRKEYEELGKGCTSTICV